MDIVNRYPWVTGTIIFYTYMLVERVWVS